MDKNLILHIPHSSTKIPDKSGYLVSGDELKNEILHLTDWYTEDLFSVDGQESVVADFSRIFCDVERFADDSQEIMSAVGMGGNVYKFDSGKDLRNLSPGLRDEILKSYYYPHHEKLNEMVTEQLNKNGFAVIIDCHSFSDEPFKRDLSQDKPRPDFCIGIDDYHTPRGLYKLAAIGVKVSGYSVRVNVPYSGSIVPMEYYMQDKRVYSVMIEVNRSLYIVPGTNEKNKNYNKVKLAIHNLLKFISNNVSTFIDNTN